MKESIIDNIAKFLRVFREPNSLSPHNTSFDMWVTKRRCDRVSAQHRDGHLHGHETIPLNLHLTIELEVLFHECSRQDTVCRKHLKPRSRTVRQFTGRILSANCLATCYQGKICFPLADGQKSLNERMYQNAVRLD